MKRPSHYVMLELPRVSSNLTVLSCEVVEGNEEIDLEKWALGYVTALAEARGWVITAQDPTS